MKKWNNKSCSAQNDWASQKRTSKSILFWAVGVMQLTLTGSLLRARGVHSALSVSFYLIPVTTLWYRCHYIHHFRGRKAEKVYTTTVSVVQSGFKVSARAGLLVHTSIPSNGVHHLNIHTEFPHPFDHTASLQSQFISRSQAEALREGERERERRGEGERFINSHHAILKYN